MITSLKPNQVFIFGSNICGYHEGGAARKAFDDFGAIYGKGTGIQGQSYAIPTLDEHFNKLGLSIIKHYLEDLDDYARTHPGLEFLLTNVGCGIAGFSSEEMESIMPIFPSNVIKV